MSKIVDGDDEDCGLDDFDPGELDRLLYTPIHSFKPSPKAR